jgi:mannonate dehydratase
MKLALGFHRGRISRDNFRFARQAGCTHLVLHLVERLQDVPMPQADEYCFGLTRAAGRVWSYDELAAVRQMAADEGLQIEALENIDPSFWSEILLDGPRKREQFEGLKRLLQDMGRLGIPVLGYNFSLAGVWGRSDGPLARGGAVVPAFDRERLPVETPVPQGELNNIVYDPQAAPGPIPTVSRGELWQRLAEFLDVLVPVAEAEGVRLAAHPDDPPVEMLRHTPRLLYRPEAFQQLLDLRPSRSNALEFCLGTIQEMAGADVYAATEQYSRQGAIAYVHCRNVRGQVPCYTEVFIDEGDLDLFRVLQILHRNGFDGVVIPDHTPQMTCPGPWHAGMAHALGYLRAAIVALGLGGRD